MNSTTHSRIVSALNTKLEKLKLALQGHVRPGVLEELADTVRIVELETQVKAWKESTVEAENTVFDLTARLAAADNTLAAADLRTQAIGQTVCEKQDEIHTMSKVIEQLQTANAANKMLNVTMEARLDVLLAAAEADLENRNQIADDLSQAHDRVDELVRELAEADAALGANRE